MEKSSAGINPASSIETSAVILKRSRAAACHPSELSGHVSQVSTDGTSSCRFIPDCLSSANVQVRNYEDEQCWDDPVRLGWRPEPALPCQQTAFLIKISQQSGAAVTLNLVTAWSLSQNEDITADWCFTKLSARFYCLKRPLNDLIKDTNIFKQAFAATLRWESNNWYMPMEKVTAIHPYNTRDWVGNVRKLDQLTY